MKYLVVECDDELSFKLADGRIMKNLGQFSESLASMSDDAFRHHVNQERNDFSNWVREVLKDQKLADDLLKTKNKAETYALVLKRIIELVKDMTV